MADDVWLLAVHPALTAALTAWLNARGLELARIANIGGEPAWTTSPTDDRLSAEIITGKLT